MRVTPTAVRQLRAVFGDCVPKDNAADVLAQSPLAPTGRALDELMAVLGDVAGQKLPAPPSSSPVRPLHEVALAQVQARRDVGGVLSEAKLAEAWRAVTAMTDVPFGFLEEGCVHRSHVVCKRLEEQGVSSEKVFLIPLGADLVMDTPRAKLGYTVVWYHEAPVVHVQTKDGVERRVLDPSVADRPLTVDEWRSTMRPAKAGVALETFFLPRFAYGLQDRDHPPDTWRPEDVASALTWNTEWRAVADSLESSGFYEELPKLLADPP